MREIGDDARVVRERDGNRRVIPGDDGARAPVVPSAPTGMPDPSLIRDADPGSSGDEAGPASVPTPRRTRNADGIDATWACPPRGLHDYRAGVPDEGALEMTGRVVALQARDGRWPSGSVPGIPASPGGDDVAYTTEILIRLRDLRRHEDLWGDAWAAGARWLRSRGMRVPDRT